MQLFISLLIFILFILIIPKTFREGLGGPMVGSVSFPTSYKAKTTIKHQPISIKERTDIFTQADTELVSKKDVRVDSSTKDQHWSELKRDVDEKKDVDIMHRLPQELNTASIEDCNKKEHMLFNNRVQLKELELEVEYLTQWWKELGKNMKKIVRRQLDLEKERTKSMKNATTQLASMDGIVRGLF